MKKMAIIITILWIVPLSAFATPVPDTGQTKCYVIACTEPGGPFYGQDAHYVTNPRSYTKLDENGNNLPDEATEWAMVRDNVTALIWEVKNSKDDIPDYDNPHDTDNTYTWYDGVTGTTGDGTDTYDFTNKLNAAQFGGFSDWRLPTVKELCSIINKDITYLNTEYFPSTPGSFYWSSTTDAQDIDSAWAFSRSGMNFTPAKETDLSVRAVRGNTSSQTLIDNDDGTVTDLTTDLMWQKEITFKQWTDALSYCENLSFAGYSDWRLPNAHELQSLVDYTLHNPALDTNFFPDYGVIAFWSSTTGLSSQLAWTVDFFHGYMGANSGDEKSNWLYVRPVRAGGVSFADLDGDNILDDVDNCACLPNSIGGGTCTIGSVGSSCMDNGDCGDGGFCSMDQEDTYPLQGNGIGDACDCEGNFNCDEDQDGSDAALFKVDFGRSSFENSCETGDPCHGDFDCDHDCDGTDAAKFKEDFGRSTYHNFCPACVVGDWCLYE